MLPKQTIRDHRGFIVGYIETQSDGRQIATNDRYQRVGYFDPTRGITSDATYRTVSRGNTLAALIWSSR